MKAYISLAAAACILIPAPAAPQALTNLSTLRVQYNTRKVTVRPQGELKAQIDEIDRQLAEVTRLGQNGEFRRLIAKGQTLLAGKPWTDELDFANSLVIRTEHVVADSGKPLAIRLEQIYRPALALERPLTARVTLRNRAAPGPATPGGPPALGTSVKELGTFDAVSRDLRDSPYRMDLDVRGAASEGYQLAVEVSDGARTLGTAILNVDLRKGLDDSVTRLEADAKRAPDTLRADILFPVDRMRNVNRARLELRTFDPDKDFAEASAVAAAVNAGKNPYEKRTGDFKRHYLLQPANEIMPFRMYVPTSYNGSRAFPLIIALHGLGGTEDSFFDGYDRKFPALAEQRGYLVAAPLGYRVDGSYGWGLGNPPADPTVRRNQDLSEQDVMAVLQLVRQQYKVDDSRIYLSGHSMGGIGTWKIAAKYPDIWAAIAPFAGTGTPATLERMKHIPEIVVHGDADPTVDVQGSRAMVAKARELGIEVTYIEVPGGNHGNVVAPNFGAVFDFFDAHRKGARPSTHP
jgi:poly(3-hydroxybutyrate) depolymerase